MSTKEKTQAAAHPRRDPAPPTAEDWRAVWNEAKAEARRIVRTALVRVIEKTGGGHAP